VNQLMVPGGDKVANPICAIWLFVTLCGHYVHLVYIDWFEMCTLTNFYIVTQIGWFLNCSTYRIKLWINQWSLGEIRWQTLFLPCVYLCYFVITMYLSCTITSLKSILVLYSGTKKGPWLLNWVLIIFIASSKGVYDDQYFLYG